MKSLDALNSCGDSTINLEAGAVAVDELAVFDDFCSTFQMVGKRVLEIGGCLPAQLTQEADVWWSIDPSHAADSVEGHLVKLRASAEQLPVEVCDVDLVFACNSFQHVGSMADCYAEIARVLVPGGKVFTHFGPIWTAPDGAHFENVKLDGGRYDFWFGARLPAWSHLVLDTEEFRDLAVAVNGRADGFRMADYVEGSRWINRLGLSEHLSLPAAAGLQFRIAHGARAFGYVFDPPPIPERFSAAFERSALHRALARHGVSPAQAQIRDLLLVLEKAGEDK